MEEVVQVEAKVWAMLSYLGPLCLWSAMKAKEDGFVRFHVKQGIVLFILEILIWSLGALPILGLVLLLVGRLLCGFMVIFGILSAVSGEERSFPLIGAIAEKLVL